MKPTILTSVHNAGTFDELVAAAPGFDLQRSHRSALLARVGSRGVVAVLIEHVDSTSDRSEALALLETIRSARPAIRRLLASEHCDLELVVHGLHSGLIHSILYRPLNFGELRAALRPGVSHASPAFGA